MKRKNSKSHATLARRKFLVEGLEPRCMLAGNVNVFVSGGTLFVQGDDSDNAVLIQQEGPGTYSVTPFDFTDLALTGEGFTGGATTINSDPDTVQGNALIFTGVKNDINVDLRGGNDALAIGNSLDALDSQARDCFGIGFIPTDGGGTVSVGVTPEVTEGTFVVPRNLFVSTGEGNDFVSIMANVGTNKKGGIASINAGNGNNGIAVGQSTIGNDLLITGGTGNDNACVTGVTVRDLLAVQLGNGDENDADIGGLEAGHALVTTGSGNDQVRMGEFDLKHELTVVTGDGNDQVDIEGFGAQNVTIDTGAGNDGSGEIFTESPALSINLPVTVSSANISKSLVLVTGSGDDFATINNVTAHDIVLNTGSGNDGDQGTPISIYNVNVKGNLTLVTGSGNDFAYMHSGDGQASNINGFVTVDMGADNDNLEIVDQSIGKDLNVFLGNGTNTAGIGGGLEGEVGNAEGRLDIRHNLNIYGGSQTDNVGLFNLSVHNDLFADLGAGADNLLLGGNEGSIIAINRNATLLGGSGGDNMSLNFTNIGGNALIDAGSNADTVLIDSCHVAKTATLLMGAGDDTLTLTNSTAAKLIARGGPGFDTFNNDLGIDSNGRSSNGKVDVQEFELLPAV
jgi:hypothetical protein